MIVSFSFFSFFSSFSFFPLSNSKRKKIWEASIPGQPASGSACVYVCLPAVCVLVSLYQRKYIYIYEQRPTAPPPPWLWYAPPPPCGWPKACQRTPFSCSISRFQPSLPPVDGQRRVNIHHHEIIKEKRIRSLSSNFASRLDETLILDVID